MRGVTQERVRVSQDTQISTHTPHARRDVQEHTGTSGTCRFQLTRLMRGVTNSVLVYMLTVEISTHTPHARHDLISHSCIKHIPISTHTPHARRDSHFLCELRVCPSFQLTRLMRGVTMCLLTVSSSAETFQLTRLMRGVTAIP